MNSKNDKNNSLSLIVWIITTLIMFISLFLIVIALTCFLYNDNLHHNDSTLFVGLFGVGFFSLVLSFMFLIYFLQKQKNHEFILYEIKRKDILESLKNLKKEIFYSDIDFDELIEDRKEYDVEKSEENERSSFLKDLDLSEESEKTFNLLKNDIKDKRDTFYSLWEFNIENKIKLKHELNDFIYEVQIINNFKLLDKKANEMFERFHEYEMYRIEVIEHLKQIQIIKEKIKQIIDNHLTN